MNDFIPVNEPLLTGNEKKYLNQCIETGWISSEGPFVRKFEEKLAKRVNRSYGIAVCNGSAALEVAIAALGISKEDEVILPTFTIISCISPIIRAGAIPVLVDSDPLTWNMDISQIENKITKKTKAIMVVHIYGLPVDIDPILALAKKYNLKIIEDAAEMHGQMYKGKPCGSFGDISTFSFYPNKLITTGEGGMVLTNNPYSAKRCRSLRNLCFQPNKRFVHNQLGWNYRMTNLQAALGVAQLEKLGKHIKRKKEIGKKYTKLLKNIKQIQLPLEKTSYAENIYWVYGMLLKDKVKFNAKKMREKLAEKNIGSRPFFYPMHLQPVFKKMGLFYKERYPIAERLARRGFYLPNGLALTDAKINKVIVAVKQIVKNSK